MSCSATPAPYAALRPGTRCDRTRSGRGSTVEGSWTRPEPSPWPARLLALAVALLVTGPALAPSFVLLRDMVAVPRQDLDLEALGLGSSLPRAVPADAVMALVTAVLPATWCRRRCCCSPCTPPSWVPRGSCHPVRTAGEDSPAPSRD